MILKDCIQPGPHFDQNSAEVEPKQQVQANFHDRILLIVKRILTLFLS